MMKTKLFITMMLSFMLTGCFSDGMPKRLLKSYTEAIELRDQAIHFVRTAKTNIHKQGTLAKVKELYNFASQKNDEAFDCLSTKTDPLNEACSVASQMEDLQRAVFILEQYVVQHSFVVLKAFPRDTATIAAGAMTSVWAKNQTDPDKAKELITAELDRYRWPDWDAIQRSRLEDELAH